MHFTSVEIKVKKSLLTAKEFKVTRKIAILLVSVLLYFSYFAVTFVFTMTPKMSLYLLTAGSFPFVLKRKNEI